MNDLKLYLVEFQAGYQDTTMSQFVVAKTEEEAEKMVQSQYSDNFTYWGFCAEEVEVVGYNIILEKR